MEWNFSLVVQQEESGFWTSDLIPRSTHSSVSRVKIISGTSRRTNQDVDRKCGLGILTRDWNSIMAITTYGHKYMEIIHGCTEKNGHYVW